MASNINPNSIDTAYPVAGADNDSQGFRDNFTNTKTNFEYSKFEISDLQNNVLVKNQLQGGDIANDHNNLNGTQLNSALMKNMSQPSITLPVVPTIEVDVKEANYYNITLSVASSISSATLEILNFPGLGTTGLASYAAVKIDLNNQVDGFELTFINSNVVGLELLPYYDDVTGIMTLPVGRFVFEFTSKDADEIIISTVIGDKIITDSVVTQILNDTINNTIIPGNFKTIVTSKGEDGDIQGMKYFDSSYTYYCIADWVDGTTDIWFREAFTPQVPW